MIDAILAATNVVDPGTSPLPTTTSGFWKWGIALVTPLVVNGVKMWVPKIPKWALPLSTPFIGLLLGAAMNALADAGLGWTDMAEAGALAVFIRECVNQAVVKQIAGPDPTT
jgi:hypothetical protein